MAKIDRVQEVSIDLLRPYENNAKIHGEDQVKRIAESIQEFGFISPCLIDKDYNIVAGHGRIMAAKKLGMDTVPCLFIEGLTETQRKAYVLADNRLTEMGEWDWQMVSEELADIDIDMSAFGFEISSDHEWFEREQRWDDSREEGNDEYNEFLDKMELPKTTDDCYTPDNIYDVVAEYVAEKFDLDRKKFMRPFFPGGDYQKELYAQDAVVVDNPPFSILAEIVDFYLERGIKFFLFCQCMLAFNYAAREGVCCYPLGLGVLFENGATIPIGFLTNLFTDGTVMDNDPELRRRLEEANKTNNELQKRNLPKYEYPYDVLIPAKAGYLSKYGEHLILKKDECAIIRQMDAQKEENKGIFGAGLLLSERAAAERAVAERAAAERAVAERAAAERAAAERAVAERAAAERAAAERAAAERAAALVFELSDREKEMQKGLR